MAACLHSNKPKTIEEAGRYQRRVSKNGASGQELFMSHDWKLFGQMGLLVARGRQK